MPRGSATRRSPSPPKRPSFKPKHFRVRSSDCGEAKLSWGLRPYAEAKREEPVPALNTLLLDLEGSHAPQQRTHQPLAGTVVILGQATCRPFTVTGQQQLKRAGCESTGWTMRPRCPLRYHLLPQVSDGRPRESKQGNSSGT